MLTPILIDDESDRRSDAPELVLLTDVNSQGGAAECLQPLSAKEEVRQWLAAFGLCFGLNDGRKARRWIDV